MKAVSSQKCLSFKFGVSVNQQNILLIWTPSILGKSWELRVHIIFENWSLIRRFLYPTFHSWIDCISVKVSWCGLCFNTWQFIHVQSLSYPNVLKIINLFLLRHPLWFLLQSISLTLCNLCLSNHSCIVQHLYGVKSSVNVLLYSRYLTPGSLASFI